jgi:hypothetical protein
MLEAADLAHSGYKELIKMCNERKRNASEMVDSERTKRPQVAFRELKLWVKGRAWWDAGPLIRKLSSQQSRSVMTQRHLNWPCGHSKILCTEFFKISAYFLQRRFTLSGCMWSGIETSDVANRMRWLFYSRAGRNLRWDLLLPVWV